MRQSLSPRVAPGLAMPTLSSLTPEVVIQTISAVASDVKLAPWQLSVFGASGKVCQRRSYTDPVQVRYGLFIMSGRMFTYLVESVLMEPVTSINTASSVCFTVHAIAADVWYCWWPAADVRHSLGLARITMAVCNVFSRFTSTYKASSTASECDSGSA